MLKVTLNIINQSFEAQCVHNISISDNTFIYENMKIVIVKSEIKANRSKNNGKFKWNQCKKWYYLDYSWSHPANIFKINYHLIINEPRTSKQRTLTYIIYMVYELLLYCTFFEYIQVNNSHMDSPGHFRSVKIILTSWGNIHKFVRIFFPKFLWERSNNAHNSVRETILTK